MTHTEVKRVGQVLERRVVRVFTLHAYLLLLGGRNNRLRVRYSMFRIYGYFFNLVIFKSIIKPSYVTLFQVY